MLRTLSAGLFGGSLAGCQGPLPGPPTPYNDQADGPCPNDSRPCVSIEYAPKNPTVGDRVVFDASESVPADDDDILFFFWDLEPEKESRFAYEAENPKVVKRFDTGGRHTVTVVATPYGNVIENSRAFPKLGYGPDDGYELARKSITINVSPLKEDRINVKNDRMNIFLKGARQSVPLSKPALLSFSATNLIGNATLVIQLILEVPTGLSVSGTSFDEGTGQYSATFEVPPGRSKGAEIEVRASEPGTYTISGQAVHYFDGEPSSRTSSSSEISVNFREESG